MSTSTFYHSLSTSFPLELHEDHDQHNHHPFFPKPQASYSSSPSSLSNLIIFNSNQEEEGARYYEESQQIQHQGDIFVSHDGLCGQLLTPKTGDTNNDPKLRINWKNNDGNGNPSGSNSIKWMSSKMRLMKKMMTSDHMVVMDHSNRLSETQKQQSTTSRIDDYKVLKNPYNDTNNTIRVCADCNTTKTPLWRSGPRGPKSLCNACGIRQRKARRAMAAANGVVETPRTPAMKSYHKVVKHKNKRSSDESCNTLPIKKRYRLASQNSRGRKSEMCFEDLPIILSKNSRAYQQVFPQDEREAAILLMALSYGLVRG